MTEKWKKVEDKKDRFIYRKGEWLVAGIEFGYEKNKHWIIGANPKGESLLIVVKRIYGNKSDALKFAKSYMKQIGDNK